MSYTCPLNFELVDSNASRLASLSVASLVIAYLLTNNEYILYFLIVDFIVKLYIDKKYSLLGWLALKLRSLFKMEEKFADGGAKRLAAIFGFVFVILLLITHFVCLDIMTYIVAAIFLSCSLLDVFFNFCLGCRVYFIVKKIYPSFMS